MTGKQRAVLWLGLILVAVNLVRKWPEISAIIFTGAGTTSPPATGGGSSGSGGNSIQVPIDPFLPTGPKITIPLPKL
jgi:uncharacterized membrane protein YgcG